jgi:3-methyladenine DNA glycosylase AlkD
MSEALKKQLETLKNEKQAAQLQRYFKTGKGEYAAGDVFLGIKVPIQRKICKNYYPLPLNDLQNLMDSKIHEHRMCALFILVRKYQRAKKDEAEKEKIFHFYIYNAKLGNINNWDLVDLSAPNIVGDFLLNNDKSILYKMAVSYSLWERRIAVLASFAFIKKNKFEASFRLAEMLMNDKHDLIHKAVGWMLREIGKRNPKAEEMFLNMHYKKMPRTMLRYAIEKFSKEKRKMYLSGEI